MIIQEVKMQNSISKESILRLIETQGIECKKSLSEQKEGMKTLNAMLNANNAKGVVLFGVSPDETICGVDPGNLDKAQLSLIQHIHSQFHPQFSPEIEIIECEGKYILIIRAIRDQKVPLYEYDGRAYIREGSSNRQLTLTEKLDIIRQRDRDHHQGPWRCNRCGAMAGQFIGVEVTDKGMHKNYNCECGGEYWPAKWE